MAIFCWVSTALARVKKGSVYHLSQETGLTFDKTDGHHPNSNCHFRHCKLDRRTMKSMGNKFYSISTKNLLKFRLIPFDFVWILCFRHCHSISHSLKPWNYDFQSFFYESFRKIPFNSSWFQLKPKFSWSAIDSP